MKVICIDDSPGRLGDDGFKLEYLKIYTVIDERIGIETGRKCYVLAEDPFMDSVFFASRFIPTSNMDETEMVRQKKEVLV